MIDVLNLEWNSSPSRDRESSTLVSNYLRLRGLNVVEGSVFQGKYLIYSLRPKVLFISNSSGSGLNIEVIKYAKKCGVKVITACAEGNFRRDQIEIFFWGVNKDRILYEDHTVLWNNRSLEMVKEFYPELQERISVGGAIGFDRYKFVNTNISRKQKKTDWLYGGSKVYSTIVLISCWCFDFLYNDWSLSNIPKNRRVRDFFTKDRERFQIILDEVINKQTDILFIIKEHPAVQMGAKGSGIEHIGNYPNVVKVKNQVPISQLISIADLVVSYESTTALEAWLMGRQSFLLNPSGTEFPCEREDYYKGQPNFTTTMEVNNALTHYISEREIPNFENFRDARVKIINEVTGFSDGLNHVRFGNKVIDLLEHKEQFNIRLADIAAAIRQKIKYLTLQSMYKLNLKYAHLNKDLRWDEKEASDLSQLRIVQQENWYEEQGFDVRFLEQIKC